ncbi:MAG TPA: hypothetical protein DC049_08100 [Spirochaetia bacterium]|nr:hypothetical protein [Spirochaetia bacterium]
MPKIKNFQELAIYIINNLGRIFKNHAILKGGMILNLIGSPRHTNDIDYTFIPFKSKKDVKDLIYNELKNLLDCEITYSINSKCLRFFIKYNENIKLQIEVNVSDECKSIEFSTMDISKINNQIGQIIRIMNYDIALAHKICAWNERRLIRDLYDIYYFVNIINVIPDIDIIKQRLLKTQQKNKKVKMTIKDLIIELKKCSEKLTLRDIENELRDYLPEHEIPGLDKKIIISLNKVIDSLQKHI